MTKAWQSNFFFISKWFAKHGWRVVSVIVGLVVLFVVGKWVIIRSPYLSGRPTTNDSGPTGTVTPSDTPLSGNNPSVVGQEYETKDRQLEGGDLVALSSVVADGIVKTKQAYHPGVIGVVGIAQYASSKRTVVTSGEVPLKVSSENGEIKRGDFVVPGDKPGMGMKACGPKYCRAGLAIGIAVTELTTKPQATPTPTNNATPTPEPTATPAHKNDIFEGKIQVAIQVRWFEPQLDQQLQANGSKLRPNNGLPWQIIDEKVMNVFYDVVSRKFVGTFGDFNIFNSRSFSVGSNALVVDDKGNLTTTGNILVKGSTLLQGPLSVSAQQAANVTIKANERSTKVVNRLVNKDSIVLVTVRQGEQGAQDGLTTSVGVEDGSFTIYLNKPVNYPVSLSWMIINQTK